MSITSKIVRGLAVGASQTLFRPLLDKDTRDWVKRQAAQERVEEAEAALAKAQAAYDKIKKR